MVFLLNSKIKIVNNEYFLNYNNSLLKIDYFLEEKLIENKEEIFLYLIKKIDKKNNLIEESVCTYSLDNINYFLWLNNIDLIGIKTIQNIFLNGVNNFKKDLEELNLFSLKKNFKLKENQIKSLLEKIKNKKNIESLKLEQTLVNLGYSKQNINKTLFENQIKIKELNFEDQIRFCIKELANGIKKI